MLQPDTWVGGCRGGVTEGEVLGEKRLRGGKSSFLAQGTACPTSPPTLCTSQCTPPPLMHHPAHLPPMQTSAITLPTDVN